jgi:hypothetical protein
MGQAVGTAAALALPLGKQSLLRCFGPAKVEELQQRLLRDDAFLPGVLKHDAADLAPRASITASSETACGRAVQLIDGVTRELRPSFGPWADGGTHRWESEGLSAWVELTWPSSQPIKTIHLTFDSGFERELTLSASDAATSKMIRAAQPELVRDYELQLDGWQVETVTENILRKRVHRFAHAIEATRLRLLVKTTHGVPVARVFEIRVYSN